MPCIMHLFLSLSLVLTLLLSVQANVCPGSTPKQRRVAVVSKSRTSISREIEKDPSLKKSARQIRAHFSELGRALRQGNPENGRAFSCVFAEAGAVRSANRVVQSYGWGRVRGCMTKVGLPGTHHHVMMKSKRFFRAVRQFAECISSSEIGGKILKTAKIHGLSRVWNKAYTNGILKYNAKETYHDCEVARTLAFRIMGTWRIAASFTNDPAGNKSSLHERLYFHEIVSINNMTNATESYPVRIRSCDANGRFLRRKAATAFVTYSSGTAAWSDFLTSPLDSNPALRGVLDDLDGAEMNIVQESDTASNFAILLLPVILALVPISLFQDVGPFVAIGYIIITDVISMLPVAIKGVELLHNARHEHHTTMSYVYGAQNSTILAAETWVSFCQLKPFVKQRGVILLTIAAMAMVIGLALECLTRARVSQLKKELYNTVEDTDDDQDGDVGRSSSMDHGAILKHMQSSSGGGLLCQLEQTRTIRGSSEADKRKHWRSWKLQRKKTQDNGKYVED